MRATWYVLEDGSTVDPSEVSLNKDGALAHKSGLVAMRSPGVPRSRGVDVDAKGKLLFGGKGDHDKNDTVGGAKQPKAEPPSAKTEDMKPEPKPSPAKKPGYKTRGK